MTATYGLSDDPGGGLSGKPSSGFRTQLTLVLFMLIVALLNADQNLMAPSLTAIGEEFGFTRAQIDQKLGADVNLIFWMLGGMITLLVGYLTDRADLTKRFGRTRMLVLVVLIGQAACFATGMAGNYEQLYWARAVTGIGVGGSFPLIFSLLGDYFTAERRAAAVAVLSLAIGIGIATGQLMAGMVGPEYGWRLPFTLVAVPGMFFTILFAFIGREPSRGQSEAALQERIEKGEVYEERLQLRDIPQVFKIRTNQLIFAQAIPGTVPWGVFFVYLNDYYAHDKGFSVQEATLLVMAIGGAAICGAFIGGMLGQFAYNRASKYLPLVCGSSTLLGAAAMAVLIAYPTAPGSSLTGPLSVGIITGLLIAMTGPNMRTMMINVNPPEHRGTAFSAYNLFDDLGKGFGAWVVGGLAATLGRVPAFHIANFMWVFCGAILLVMMKYFPRDEASLQRSLADKDLMA